MRLMEGDTFTDGPDNGGTGITVSVTTITYGTASSGPAGGQGDPGGGGDAPYSSGNLAPGADLLGVAYVTICRPSTMGLICETDCGDGGWVVV
jgi:hypothetical protein